MNRIEHREGLARYPNHRAALAEWMAMVEPTRSATQALGPVVTTIDFFPANCLRVAFGLSRFHVAVHFWLVEEDLLRDELVPSVVAQLMNAMNLLLERVKEDPECRDLMLKELEGKGGAS